MDLKLLLLTVAAFLMLAHAAEAKHVSRPQRRSYDEKETDVDESLRSFDGHHSHRSTQRGVSHKTPRGVRPHATTKKLVLLRFKKIEPISVILLRSGNESNAELVPVYPTSEIPANVQFIPTPNGISGHKDVQAIAIPNELHEQLQANGLANIENLNTLLKDTRDQNSNKDDSDQAENSTPNNTPLSVNDSDPNQALEGIAIAKKKTPQENDSAASSSERLAADKTANRVRFGLKGAAHTAVEDIPLFVYSGRESPAWHVSGVRPAQNNRRKHS